MAFQDLGSVFIQTSLETMAMRQLELVNERRCRLRHRVSGALTMMLLLLGSSPDAYAEAQDEREPSTTEEASNG